METQPPSPDASRSVTLDLEIQSFERYVRSVAEISAESGLECGLTVEGLMAYCVDLPEVDDLVTGFLRGDLTMFSLEEQTRGVVERDTRFLELDTPLPSVASPGGPPSSRLGRQLASRRPGETTAEPPSESDLERFIRENPEVSKQVRQSNHDFLVRWVMLHLMQVIRARERGHRIAHEFWTKFPEAAQRIRANAVKPPATTVKIRP